MDLLLSRANVKLKDCIELSSEGTQEERMERFRKMHKEARERVENMNQLWPDGSSKVTDDYEGFGEMDGL